MRLSVGTSGFSYKEWKGPFYPDDLPAGEMLAYYAERLPAVEINNTFYRMPKVEVLESWAAQVPENFRFAIKASRRITHFKRLKETGAETGYLLNNTAVLGERLGLLLFQLPPNLKVDLDRLDAFLELLPEGTRAAFEFRHASWWDDAVFERLRNRQLAIVLADTEEEPVEEILVTAPQVYLRLRSPAYERADLASWAKTLGACDAEEAFVFFKHEDAGAGPRMAGEFLEVAERAGRRRGPQGVEAAEAAKDRRAG